MKAGRVDGIKMIAKRSHYQHIAREAHLETVDGYRMIKQLVYGLSR